MAGRAYPRKRRSGAAGAAPPWAEVGCGLLSRLLRADDLAVADSGRIAGGGGPPVVDRDGEAGAGLRSHAVRRGHREGEALRVSDVVTAEGLGVGAAAADRITVAVPLV